MEKNKENHQKEQENPQFNSTKEQKIETNMAESDNKAIDKQDNQIEELKNQLLRALAEVENVRKIKDKQIEDMSKFAVSKFAGDIISVVENLYRANDNIPTEKLENDPLVKNINDGIEIIKKDLTSTLGKYGVKRIFPTAGDQFDHNIHQAVSQVEEQNFTSGSVISVMQAGYILHDRLLRPAMVIVAK